MAEFSAIADDNEILEPGEYAAIFREVEAPDEPGQYGLYLELSFDVLTPDGPVRVTGRASRPVRYTRSTKVRQWYEAIDGRLLEKGDVMSFSKLIGKPCRLVLEVKDTERGSFNRIVNVLPAKAPRRPAAPVADADDDLPPYPDEEDGE
jgi:hypothetical protein